MFQRIHYYERISYEVSCKPKAKKATCKPKAKKHVSKAKKLKSEATPEEQKSGRCLLDDNQHEALQSANQSLKDFDVSTIKEQEALYILLTTMQQGLNKFPETCLPDVTFWNGISNYCINSHIAIPIALLLMAIRGTNISHWKDTHTEVLFALSNAVS